MLDLTKLRDAITALDNSVQYIARLQDNPNYDYIAFETSRAGVIHNFETAYELCWKIMKRWLDKNFNVESETSKSKKQLFRIAGEYALIDNFALWVTFNEKRNLTAHTYNENTAEEVYIIAVKFLPEAKKFLSILETRND